MSSIIELYGQGKLFLEGTPSPALDARLILQKCTGLSQEDIFREPEHSVSAKIAKSYYQLLKIRKNGCPLAYLLEEKEFWSIPFRVKPGVLIPRPETELIVEKVLDYCEGDRVYIADIGTGCGNIAVSVAKELPLAKVFAIDISRRALKVARLNAVLQRLNNVSFYHGFLFSPIQKKLGKIKFDFILSNPPYVSLDEWSNLSDEIKYFEPKEALLGGRTGLDIIKLLIAEAPKFLKPGGWLILEFGAGQKDKIFKFFSQEWKKLNCFNDLNGIPRVFAARL